MTDGIGWIGQMPAVDVRDVDAARRDAIAVGRPPVAAHAAHLLGGDELGRPPRHVRVGVLDDPRRAVEVGDAERPTRHVGDTLTRRIGSRIEHRSLGGDLTRGAGEQVDREEPPRERERREPRLSIGRVRDDAAGLLTSALAAGALLRGEVGVGGVEEIDGIDDVDLFAAVDVEHPQAVHRIVAGSRSHEHDPVAVRRHHEVPRLAEREPASARVLAGEGVGHGRGLCLRLHEDLGVGLGVAEVDECLRHAVDADGARDDLGIARVALDERAERAGELGRVVTQARTGC